MNLHSPQEFNLITERERGSMILIHITVSPLSLTLYIFPFNLISLHTAVNAELRRQTTGSQASRDEA